MPPDTNQLKIGDKVKLSSRGRSYTVIAIRHGYVWLEDGTEMFTRPYNECIRVLPDKVATFYVRVDYGTPYSPPWVTDETSTRFDNLLTVEINYTQRTAKVTQL